MSEQLYSMRAQGIGKADATFSSFTENMIKSAKMKYADDGFIFFNVSKDAANPPPHDYSFEKNIDSALKLQKLVKEGMKNADPCAMLDGCYELEFYKSLIEESEK